MLFYNSYSDIGRVRRLETDQESYHPSSVHLHQLGVVRVTKRKGKRDKENDMDLWSTLRRQVDNIGLVVGVVMSAALAMTSGTSGTSGRLMTNHHDF